MSTAGMLRASTFVVAVGTSVVEGRDIDGSTRSADRVGIESRRA
jgi:hypothetical protein